MELSPGYKQTEVGVIPASWDVQILSSLIREGPRSGYSARSAKNAGGTPTLTLGATTSGALILNDRTIKQLEETIDGSSDLFLQVGDVLVQRSNTADLVGTTAIFDGPSGLYVYPDLMMRMRFREEATAHWFWRYANSLQGRRFFITVAAGSSGSMPKISGEKLRGMPLPLPPLPEQRAIAATLSDVDALLEGLTRLIAKKRDLKQAAMQQLLTGQNRLPGFCGEWKGGTLASVITALDAGVSVNSAPTDTAGGSTQTCVLKTSAVMGGKFLPHECKPVASRDLHRASLSPRRESIIVSRMNTRELIGECGYVEGDYPDLFLPDRLWMARLQPNVSGQWLTYVLSSESSKRRLADAATGTSGSMKNLSKRAFLSIAIAVPPPTEQMAIATVLSDMDAELAALEARREKTSALKQAMMQELLTGRTRLV